MIDWNKRNGGFLDDFNVINNQVSNLSQQIDKLNQELQRKNNIINELKKELEDDGRFELFYADDTISSVMTLGAKYYREYILDKIKELENSGSDE